MPSLTTFLSTLTGKIILLFITVVVGATIIVPKIVKDPIIAQAEKDAPHYFLGVSEEHYKDLKLKMIKKEEREAIVRAEFSTVFDCAVARKTNKEQPLGQGYIELSIEDLRTLYSMELIEGKTDSHGGYYTSRGTEKGSERKGFWKRCYMVFLYQKMGDNWKGSQTDGFVNNFNVIMEMESRHFFMPPSEQKKLGHKAFSGVPENIIVDTTEPTQTTTSTTLPEKNQSARPQLVIGDSAGIEPKSDDHTRGNSDDFILIEYAGLQSKFSKDKHVDLLNFWNENKNRLAWIYRHFTTLSDEQKLAEATECAKDLGGNEKFWEAVDRYSSKASLDDSILYGHVNGMRLDKSKFKECFDSGKFEGKVKKSTKDAKGLINGTPTLFFYSVKTKKIVRVNEIKSVDELRQIFNGFVEQVSKL